MHASEFLLFNEFKRASRWKLFSNTLPLAKNQILLLSFTVVKNFIVCVPSTIPTQIILTDDSVSKFFVITGRQLIFNVCLFNPKACFVHRTSVMSNAFQREDNEESHLII